MPLAAWQARQQAYLQGATSSPHEQPFQPLTDHVIGT